MNVTPPDNLYRAMCKLCDHFVGEEPARLETTPAAERRREERRSFMDMMHTFVRLTMREGVRRYCEERGLPMVEDAIRPDPISKAVREALPASGTIATDIH